VKIGNEAVQIRKYVLFIYTMFPYSVILYVYIYSCKNDVNKHNYLENKLSADPGGWGRGGFGYNEAPLNQERDTATENI
jgi:hypothetical protein